MLYTLKNAGRTNISSINLFWHAQRNASIFPRDCAEHWAEANLLNYSLCHDKRVRADETISLRICYHKSAIASGLIAATFSIGMIDDNGRHWIQPFFAPDNKVYDSREISMKEYFERLRIDSAVECFKNPGLW